MGDVFNFDHCFTVACTTKSVLCLFAMCISVHFCHHMQFWCLFEEVVWFHLLNWLYLCVCCCLTLKDPAWSVLCWSSMLRSVHLLLLLQSQNLLVWCLLLAKSAIHLPCPLSSCSLCSFRVWSVVFVFNTGFASPSNYSQKVFIGH